MNFNILQQLKKSLQKYTLNVTLHNQEKLQKKEKYFSKFKFMNFGY